MMREIELYQYRIPKNDINGYPKNIHPTISQIHLPTKQSNFQLRLRKYSIWKNIEIVVSNF